MLFTVIPLILLILGHAWAAVSTLFTVILFLLLILGRTWEADFDFIYGDPAQFADLRTRLGIRSARYLR